MKNRPKIIINMGTSPTLIQIVGELLDKASIRRLPTDDLQSYAKSGEIAVRVSDASSTPWDYTSSYRKFLNTDYKGYRIIDAATQMGELIELLEAPQEIEVKLNDKYTAVVSEDGLSAKVGCQDFTFEAVDRLHKAMVEAQK